METFELVINIPTLNEFIGWFVCWFCFGVMFNVIHSIAFVSCDYGRTARSMRGIALFAMVILDSLFWPANIKSIRDNISVDRFNR